MIRQNTQTKLRDYWLWPKHTLLSSTICQNLLILNGSVNFETRKMICVQITSLARRVVVLISFTVFFFWRLYRGEVSREEFGHTESTDTVGTENLSHLFVGVKYCLLSGSCKLFFLR